ncbi:MAG: hypothetical protein ACT4QB_00695 [Gammaproteobacteria bacterium]
MADGGPYRSLGADRRQRWTMALVWLLVAIGLTKWAVQRSTQVGRLAAPPRYDDVGYFNAALGWLRRWNELGPLDALTVFLQEPPRAPFPELLAAGSFAIGGVDLAVPYFASFFIPWAALLWVSRFARGVRAIERLLIGLYACTIPLLTVGVTQFRPDPFWGIVLGGAMGLLLTERMVGARAPHLIAVGASFSAACLIKTSTFPITAAALCAGVVLGAIADRYSRPTEWSWRAAIRSALIIGAAAAMVVLPYYALAGRTIFDYIYINAVGRDVYIWLTPGDWWYHLAYYSFGGAGLTMFGYQTPLLLSLVAAGIVAAGVKARAVGAQSREPLVRLVAFTLGVGVLYALPTMVPTKSPYFGAAFGAGLIFLAVYSVARLLEVFPQRVGRVSVATVALVLLVAAGASAFRWPLAEGRPDDPMLADRTRLHRELVGALRAFPPTPAPRRLWVTAPAPITAAGLQWMVDREGLGVQVVRDYREPDLSALMRKFADIDLVFAQEEGGIYLSKIGRRRMPAVRMQGEILCALRARGDLRIVATLRESGGKELYLFQREPAREKL